MISAEQGAEHDIGEEGGQPRPAALQAADPLGGQDFAAIDRQEQQRIQRLLLLFARHRTGRPEGDAQHIAAQKDVIEEP